MMVARDALGTDDVLREVLGAKPLGDGVVITRERQVSAMRHARAALGRIEAGATQDVQIIELEAAITSLNQVIGRDVGLEVLDQIFSEFCIGK